MFRLPIMPSCFCLLLSFGGLFLAVIVLGQPPPPLGGGIGWASFPATFKIQSPTNVPQSDRYWATNNIYHCEVFSTDGAFAAGNTTLPRTEQRFNPDYTNGGKQAIGEIQYQSTEMAPSNENSYCVFQIHTGDAESGAFGSTTFMLFWFTNNNGSVHDYSGTLLASNLGNRWFQLNVDHNLVSRIIRVWINRNLVWTQQDNGAGDFYFKDGVYEQSHDPTLQMDTYITNILMWTNPGVFIPHINGMKMNGTTLTMTATNGPANGQFVLMGSTNLALPRSQWTPIFTNSFDGNGNLDLSTNIINPNSPLEFYLLQMP
jgi:hypothetical protein